MEAFCEARGDHPRHPLDATTPQVADVTVVLLAGLHAQQFDSGSVAFELDWPPHGARTIGSQATLASKTVELSLESPAIPPEGPVVREMAALSNVVTELVDARASRPEVRHALSEDLLDEFGL